MENTAFDPSKTAVLVIDMQKAFTEPESPICVAGAKETIPAIAKFVDQAREAGMAIFWICRQHLADGSDMEEFRRKLLKREGCLDLLAPSNPMSLLAPALKIKKQDQIIAKTRFSAFYQTKLEGLLKAKGIDTLILMGTQTSNCIRATAYDAIARDYQTIVIGDCTSSASKAVQASNLRDLENAGVIVVKKADSLGKTLHKLSCPGTIYQLKASLSFMKREMYRTFEFPETVSIGDAAYAILNSFQAEFGHCYDIECKGVRYEDEIQAMYSEEPSQSLKVPLSQMNLVKGDEMILTYDYGSDWKFIIKVTKVIPDGDLSVVPKIIKGAGQGIIEDIFPYDLAGAVEFTKRTNKPFPLKAFFEDLDEDETWDYRDFDLSTQNRDLAELFKRG